MHSKVTVAIVDDVRVSLCLERILYRLYCLRVCEKNNDTKKNVINLSCVFVYKCGCEKNVCARGMIKYSMSPAY